MGKGQIVTITSRKGGVGKTTMTLNLAGCFSILKKKTLIIDLDLDSGGVALSLNVNCKKNIYDLVDDLKYNRYKNFEDYIAPYNEYISTLCAPNDPREAKKIESEYITKIIEYSKYKYDVILIDTTHIINASSIIALDESDINLYIITNDPVDLKNIKSMIKIYNETGENNYRVILNESRDTGKDYFSDFDIKNIIGTNIDYSISKDFYIKDIDKYVLEGKILTLNKKIQSNYKKDIAKLMNITKNILRGGSDNEKEDVK
ncbi:MAG: AAA family ATPase [Bacilli bacterium]